MTIAVGLVGFGLAGSTFHAPLIASIPELVLKTVVSRDAAKVHDKYPDVQVVSTLAALLQDPDISLVVVATPNETHYALGRQALEAGRHVVLDKPMTIRTEEADTLIELASSRSLRLSVFHNRRWDNDFLTVCSLVQKGTLGDITAYEAHYDRFRPTVSERWREQAGEGTGTLYDLGAHLIDQALFLFGAPDWVWADVRAQREQAQVDDYFHLVLSYARHTAILHSGSLVREPGPRFEVHGSLGSFIKCGLDSQEEALRAGQVPGSPGWGEDKSKDYGELTLVTARRPVKTLPGHYQAFYEGMAQSILHDAPLPVTPHDARQVIAVIEAARRSALERSVVPLAKANLVPAKPRLAL